jgi:octaprenyl-diphosphate synthase
MSELEAVKSVIGREIEVFENKFKTSMESRVPLLDIITRYIIKRKGKQMRPMFVFLSAKIFGEINETTYRAASLIELLHTATLVHDDVVDDSNERRGFFSINALWKNKIAVLVGDYLLSKGLLLALNNEEYTLLKIVSDAVKEMSEGELLQIEKARKLDIKEDIYYEIIRKKTASLIASCCACGTASITDNKEIIKKMHDFGTFIGIAFQIKDDLFDYEKSRETGKPNGIDIKEQKMTLPLIYMLNNCSYSEKKSAINIVKNYYNRPDKVSELINKVNNSGGIEYSVNKMNEYKTKALEILYSLPENEARKAMEILVNYTIDRKK